MAPCSKLVVTMRSPGSQGVPEIDEVAGVGGVVAQDDLAGIRPIGRGHLGLAGAGGGGDDGEQVREVGIEVGRPVPRVRALVAVIDRQVVLDELGLGPGGAGIHVDVVVRQPEFLRYFFPVPLVTVFATDDWRCK